MTNKNSEHNTMICYLIQSTNRQRTGPLSIQDILVSVGTSIVNHSQIREHTNNTVAKSF